MEELFLDTKQGIIQIDYEQIEKHNIREGTRSPFTRWRIVDKNGKYISDAEETSNPGVDEIPAGEGLEDDEIVEMPGGEIYSKSEIIDLSQGVDSSVEENKDEFNNL